MTGEGLDEDFERKVLAALSHLERRIDSLFGEVGRLKGRGLEQRVRDETRHFLRGLVAGARTVELEDVIENVAPGTISAEGLAALQRADLIASGSLRSDHSTTVHLVVEVSWRIDAHDVRRARDRAGILAKATGQPALPAVIADDEPTADVVAVALDQGVAVVDGDGIVVSPGTVVEA
ncbi:MAG TPA: hypothetical protein VGS21_04025 [Acidimicrobiales bacterium]|nr:hypothetical protein [Acidimicrobiales bacterium]